MRLVVLGSTGSIGRQTLDVVRSFPDRLRVVGLSARRDVEGLMAQAREFQPEAVCLLDGAAAARWTGPAPLVGEAGLMDLVEIDADAVLVAVVGLAALRPALRALERGRRLLVATKEMVVAAGGLLRRAQRSERQLLPVDSEHSALFQLLACHRPEEVAEITLTASGGPFRDWSEAAMARATPADALRHPTWRMGAKNTIDSATLMNKGLEVIEAHELFQVDYDAISVLVHPESVVHAVVTLRDGASVAHLGPTDMRAPIQYALLYPERRPGPAGRLDLGAGISLGFGPVDTERFPSLRLAYAAGRMGLTMPAVLSAANAVAVDAFVDGRIGFADIPRIVAATLEAHAPVAVDCADQVLAADAWARERAEAVIAGREGAGP